MTANSNTVIALSGWKGSGKDTVAHHLVSEYNFKQLSFAARLKDMVANVYGVPREDLDNPTKKELPLPSYPAIPTDPFSETVHTLLKDELKSGYWTPRALCILEGSMKRAAHPNFWVQSVIREIVNNPDTDFVISDLRFQSEADTLKLFVPQVKTVRIQRYSEISTNDPSERNLDNYEFNYTLFNTMDRDTLYQHVGVLVNTLEFGRPVLTVQSSGQHESSEK